MNLSIWIFKTCLKFLGHNFNKAPLLNNIELINELKNLSTINPAEGVIVQAAGVPLRISMAC